LYTLSIQDSGRMWYCLSRCCRSGVSGGHPFDVQANG